MIENLFGGGGGGGTVDTVVAGTGISVNSTDPANPIITNTSLNTDEVAKVSSNDTTAGYLNGKLVAGSGISLTENNNGGNETLGIAVSNLDAGAITTGTIGTARLATGTANSSTYLRGDQTWATISAGDTTYSLTLADAENTTNLINVAQFVIPANTLLDQQMIFLEYGYVGNCGANANITSTIRFNSGAGNFSHSSQSVAVTAGGSSRGYVIVPLFRDGSTVLRTQSTGTNRTYDVQNGSTHWNTQNFYQWNNWSGTTVNFTTDITVSIQIQWSVANAGNYLRTINGRAWKPAGLTT